VRRLVVLDFDGTLAVGDEPVLAYFRGVAGGAADEAFARWVETGDGHRDGYSLVAAWAGAHGVAEDVRAAAYASSRAALHAGEVAVLAPDGLAALLDRRPDDVRCVLVTNAPVDGIEPVLERLGLAGRLDALIGDARKPTGMRAVLDRLLAETGLPPAALLSVGDVWENDLAPAAALGAATAFVDRFDRREGAPTYRARTLTELLPHIERWWTA
jgi:FMN phosphatase YigB (HAD superfamily)